MKGASLLGFALSAVLLPVLAAPASASGSASVQPDHLQTLSGANIYFTVFNGRSSPLYNITIMMPGSLAPVGLYTSSGRWLRTIIQEAGSYHVAWFGGPVESNQSVVLGLAVIVPATSGTYNATVTESYQGNVTESSIVEITVYCPCLLGVDVRTLSYSLVGVVLLLPLVELGLHSLRLLRNGRSATTG